MTRTERTEQHIASAYTWTSDLDPEFWDRWVTGHAHGHPLQLSGWAQLKGRFGWRSHRVGVTDGRGNILAGVQLLLRSAFGLKLAYAPRGPLTDWEDEALTSALLDAVRSACRELGVAVLKIEPDLPDTGANQALLQCYGFRRSGQTIQPPSTVLLDLHGDDDAMLQAMKSKWRYNVRLAARKGVTVRPMTRADLPLLHALMHTTGQRDGFAIHSNAYYDAAFELLAPDHGAFLLAEYEGKPLGAIVVATAGPTAVYLWGASSDAERNRMPNHALQWAGMQWARDMGARRYDLWGVPDPIGVLAQGLRNGDGSGTSCEELPLDMEALPTSGLWGVYRFKQGFGGHVVRFAGAWDMPIEPLGYRIYQLGVKAEVQLRERLDLRRLLARPDAGTRPTGRGAATTLRPVTTPAAWNAALAELPDPHVLQSWEWGLIKGQTGWQAGRYLLATPAGKAAFQLLWRRPLRQLPIAIGYVPKGPVLDWSNLELVDAVLANIEAQARALGCIFVKIDPDVREDRPEGKLVLHALQRRGWHFSAEQIQYKNTACTDLTQGADALLAQMKSKWRYNVRLAARRGITVRLGTEADLAGFYDLYAETGQRDGFLIRPFDYYRTTWQTYLRAEGDEATPAGGALLLAEHPDDRQPVAGLFLMRYGARAWYFYGASSERHRRDMPNYLLQWEAMCWAMERGCTHYDWWGAPTDLDDAEDELQGVWQFKQGFEATFQPHIGAWDFPISPLFYRLFVESLPTVLAALRRLRA